MNQTRVGTIGAVPRPATGQTPKHNVRVTDADWADLGADADALGMDRAKVINQLIRWWLRRPGAELPERPPAR